MGAARRFSNRPPWSVVFIVAFVALAVGLFGAGPASAATASAAETRVGASHSTATVLVGLSAGITAGQRLGNGLPQPRIVVATGVAAETAGTATGCVSQTASQASEWLGPEARSITNGAGDKIFLSRNGPRRIRVDIKQHYPHSSPHAHVEQLIDGSWVKSGPIYPSDVPAG